VYASHAGPFLSVFAECEFKRLFHRKTTERSRLQIGVRLVSLHAVAEARSLATAMASKRFERALPQPITGPWPLGLGASRLCAGL